MRSTYSLTVGLVLSLIATMGASHPTSTPIVDVADVGVAPAAITVDEQTQRAFVVNHGPPYTVSILNTATGQVLRTMPVSSDRFDGSERPAAVDARHNRALTLNMGSDTVSLLDATTGRLLHTVSLGFAPQFIAVDASMGRAFIPNSDEEADDAVVEVLDTVRMRMVRAIPMRGDALVVDEQTGHLFIRTFAGVSMLDAATDHLLATAHIAGLPVAVDARVHRVFVLKANPVYTGDFRLSVLDTRTAAVVRTFPLPLESTYSLIVDSQRGRAYLATGGAIDVFDSATGRLLRTIVVRQGPSRFASSPLAVDSRTGYVYAVSSPLDQYGDPTNVAYLRVFDPATGAFMRSIAIGPSPVAIAIDNRTRRVFIVHAGSGESDQQRPGRRGTVTVLDASRL